MNGSRVSSFFTGKLKVVLLVLLVMLTTTMSAVEFVVTDRPSNLGRTEKNSPEQCLRHASHPATKGLPAQYIINFCARVVYLSVVELDVVSGAKYCAVYGLQGGKYGKKYGPGEMYDRNSVNASFDADRALEHCKYSGYEITGAGIGEFVRFVK